MTQETETVIVSSYRLLRPGQKAFICRGGHLLNSAEPNPICPACGSPTEAYTPPVTSIEQLTGPLLGEGGYFDEPAPLGEPVILNWPEAVDALRKARELINAACSYAGYGGNIVGALLHIAASSSDYGTDATEHLRRAVYFLNREIDRRKSDERGDSASEVIARIIKSMTYTLDSATCIRIGEQVAQELGLEEVTHGG